ncbi:uncharacterized protein LOC110990431 [Acanthaster planci]|uniref:Uncharacterized protein LOC110990431 n=1 Tax=Acanthaster planci TaxID=133434 RepID=A0A8B8A5A7_ACAPL|nr:uncharacterized protein LOC110990431 [Acanthaster planci]
MLSEWRGKGSSRMAQTTQLCAALAVIGRKDLAYELQVLNDNDVYKMSKVFCREWKDKAFDLGFSRKEVVEIESISSYQGPEKASETLEKWRERQSWKEDDGEVLCRALEKVDKKDLADELRKDKNSFIDGIMRLRRVAYMLTLEPGSKELIGQEFLQPPKMIINNQEDLRSLRDDVGEPCDEPLHVEMLDVWCRSREDIDLLREILKSAKFDFLKHLQLQLQLSENWKEELQSLVQTFQPGIKLPEVHLVLFGRNNIEYDIGHVGKCLFEITSQFPGKMGLSPCNIFRSHRDVQRFVDALKACKLQLLGCPRVDLHGHVDLLAPLITDCLKIMWLNQCNLTDDDASDLTCILSKCHGLQKLDVHCNKFSMDGISDITSYLTLEHFPNLIRLDVYDMGLDAAQVKEVVKKNLPHLKETETGIFKIT